MFSRFSLERKKYQVKRIIIMFIFITLLLAKNGVDGWHKIERVYFHALYDYNSLRTSNYAVFFCSKNFAIKVGEQTYFFSARSTIHTIPTIHIHQSKKRREASQGQKYYYYHPFSSSFEVVCRDHLLFACSTWTSSSSIISLCISCVVGGGGQPAQSKW